VQLEGEPVVKSSDVLETIGTRRPGDEISLVVNRKGRELSFTLVLANQKGKKKLVSRDNSEIMDALGASLETLDKDSASELGIEGGVEVKELASGILKSQTDMREGFIITGVNKVPVKSVGDLEKELKSGKLIYKSAKHKF